MLLDAMQFNCILSARGGNYRSKGSWNFPQLPAFFFFFACLRVLIFSLVMVAMLFLSTLAGDPCNA